MDTGKIYCSSCKANKNIEKGKTCERCRERKRRYRDKLPKRVIPIKDECCSLDWLSGNQEGNGAKYSGRIFAREAALTDVGVVKAVEEIACIMAPGEDATINDSQGAAHWLTLYNPASLHKSLPENLGREGVDVNKNVLQIVESALEILGTDGYQKRIETLKRVKLLVIHKQHEDERSYKPIERKRRKKRVP